MRLSEIFYSKVSHRLLRENKNWLCCICGETGSGKSYSAMSVADNIAPEGLRIENVVFNPQQFMERLNSGDMKKGDILIFDEAGVGMSSRDWMTVQNKLLGAVLQTFRNMNVGCIFTTPNLSFVDVQARTLLHCYMETRFINKRQMQAHLRVLNINHNSRMNKTFYRRPRFYFHDQIIMMRDLAVPLPRPDLLRDYEKVKLEYTKELNKKVAEDLAPKEKGGRSHKEYDYEKLAKDLRNAYPDKAPTLAKIGAMIGGASDRVTRTIRELAYPGR